MNKRLLSVDEAAQYLGIASQSIYNWRQEGNLPFPIKRIGRRVLIDIKALDRYIDELPDLYN